MPDDEECEIGPKIPSISPQRSVTNKLAGKLNYFFELRDTKGLSLNQQLASHPDFHAPGITETLLDFLRLDPWGSNLQDDVARPCWDGINYNEQEEQMEFDYLKVAQDQRQEWESKNSQIMNATSRGKSQMIPPATTAPAAKRSANIQMPRKRI